MNGELQYKGSVQPRDDAAELSAGERAAYLTYLFCHGGRYTYQEVATLCGYSGVSGAWMLCDQLSRVVPIRRSDDDGRWELVGRDG